MIDVVDKMLMLLVFCELVVLSRYLRLVWLTFEKVGNGLQLWNVVFPKAAVVDKQWKYVVELLARVRRVQLRQLTKHRAPRPTTYSQP